MPCWNGRGCRLRCSKRVPGTATTTFAAVADALARRVRARGGGVHAGVRVISGRRAGGETVLETSAGPVRARLLVACAGLHADRLARACGLEPEVRIVPF